VTIVYCHACGWMLDVAPARPRASTAFGLGGVEEVGAPAVEESLEGEFQMRCRDMVNETRSLGFNPNVWVSMINTTGATDTARKLLADHHVLVATPWLVERGHAELTVEFEIGQPKWGELFTEEERSEAARRLAAAQRSSSDG
jgi:hypothetical protein